MKRWALLTIAGFSLGVQLANYDRMRGVPIRPVVQCRLEPHRAGCEAGMRAVLKANGPFGGER